VVSFSLDIRMHLLATGRYLTVLSQSVFEYNRERWSLRRLPVELGVPDMPLAVFTLRNRTISPVAQLFVAQAKAVAKAALNR
jgi:hypothetical protein